MGDGAVASHNEADAGDTMTVDAIPSDAFIGADLSASGSGRRVAVLFERGRKGEAALREASEASSAGGELTVVTLAPQAQPGGCLRCRVGLPENNCAVREEADVELRHARELLGAVADRTAFKVLVERRDPPLAVWVAEQLCDLVILPARRLPPRGHPLARALRRAHTAEVRVVG